MIEEDLTDEEIKEYIAGIFDGDGSLGASIHTSDSTKTGCSISANARIIQTYDSDPSYISGVFDAEGDISIQVMKSERGKIGYYLKSESRINQNVGDYILPFAIRLKRYCDEVGCDVNLSFDERDNEKWADSIQFRIGTLDKVDNFLRGIRDYSTIKLGQIDIMLEEILPRLRKGTHHNKIGFIETMEWVDKMNSLKGGSRGEYSADYFKDLWEEDIEQRINIEEFYDNELSEEEESIFKE